MVKNIIITFICLFSLTMFCCKTDRQQQNRSTHKVDVKVEPIEVNEINKVNFYFENSGSINGYLNGEGFQQTVRRILVNAPQDSLFTYFVNTKEYEQTDIKNKIANKKIKTVGTGNSDHKFIFTNAIKKANDNNLSIVITDGIYSMKDGNISLVEIDIEDAFKKGLKQNELETVVLKMSSNFKGRYYSESCKKKGGIQIDQERPYYVLLFGNKKIINKALKEIVIIEDLEGFKEQARFFITKDLKVNYTVLTKGEKKQGNFKAKGYNKLFNVKEIEDAEKFSKNGLLLKDRYLQFGIAVDYSHLSIPSSYLSNESNYSIENNTDYKLTEILSVNQLSKNSQTYNWIQNLNKRGSKNFSHILIVRAKSKIYGELKINLDINFPTWIKETGTNNDCEIKNDNNTTFAFDRLMDGISKGYRKINNKNKFFELKINIKP